MRVIFDLGCHLGGNIPYYLTKADRVVAVEANPEYVNSLLKKYQKEIMDKKLFLINCILVPADFVGNTHDFYIEVSEGLRSKISLTEKELISETFMKTSLPCRKAVEIIKENLEAEDEIIFLKIDLEGLDDVILKDIFEVGIYPREIYFENHSYLPLKRVSEARLYSSFKVIEPLQISENLQLIQKSDLSMTKSISAPFGEDLKQDWIGIKSKGLLIRKATQTLFVNSN